MPPLFPYFGGKSRIAPLIWDLLGDVESYVEPFFGSGAVLAARPKTHRGGRKRVELVGDLNGWLVNAWRAVAHAPAEILRTLSLLSYSEADLRAAKARVYAADLQPALEADLEFYDAELAALWLAIMGGFVATGGAENSAAGTLSTGCKGRGVWAQDFGPDLLAQWSTRMRDVRMLAGPWERCLSSWGRICGGNIRPPAGVYLDPPYADGADTVYGARHDKTPAAAAAEWAIVHGEDPNYRIVYSGYTGTVSFPPSWREIPWEASGGFGRLANAGAGRDNAKRERLWASPYCLREPETIPLSFDF